METPEIPPGTIVVGVDGSSAGDQALAWAIEQAVLEQRPLTLVHSIDGSTAWLNQPGLDRGVVLEAMHSDGRAILARAQAEVTRKAADLTVRLVLRLADPRVVLVELSADAALIVLGSRGRGPVRSLLLGSVGLVVSEHASCPVVVLRPRKVGAVRNGVLVGVDGTEHSGPVLEFAYRQASLRGLPLTVMHCHLDVQAPTTWARDVSDDEPGWESQRLALSESVAGMGEKFPDVNVRLKLCGGLPDDCLVSASQKMDLVVVGSHPRSRLAGIVFLDVGRRVVEHAKCLVAVVPCGR